MKYLVLLTLLGLGSFYHFFKPMPNPTENINIKQQKKSDQTGLWFVATGFGSDLENYEQKNLISDLESGKIFVLENNLTAVEKIFGLKPHTTLSAITLKDFILKAKTNLILIHSTQLTPQLKALKINNISFFENPETYPLNFEADVKSKLTHLVMTGVTAITRVGGKVADKEGPLFLTKLVRDHFQTADFVHISNEVSFKENCEFLAGTQFCSKETHFEALTDLRCNIVELTGNHNRDYGNDPFLKTWDWYEKRKIGKFGAGRNETEAEKPLVIEVKNGKKVAFIGFNEYCPLNECAQAKTPGALRYNKEKSIRIIDSLKKSNHFVIVSCQFGERDSYEPSYTQMKICREWMDAGADVVYGSQAHQVQQIEFYKNKPIFYGLGNFLFDQVHRVGVRQGYFLHYYFYDGKLIQTQPVYTYTTDERRPSIATSDQTKAIKLAIFKDEWLYKN